MIRRLDYIVRPIEAWPGKRTPVDQRVRAPFKGSWSRTESELAFELGMLQADAVILRVDVSPGQIRQDGQLYANARVYDAGVLIEFLARKLPGEPRLVYRCDRFRYWQDNLLAIARALEALRLVDRYAVTSAGEQYAGFKALPSSTAPTLSSGQAAAAIGFFSDTSSDDILANVGVAKAAVRVALNRTHPDKHDGSRDAYDRVDAARKALTAHHGVSL